MNSETVETIDLAMTAGKYRRMTNGTFLHSWRRANYEVVLSLKPDNSGCILMYKELGAKVEKTVFSSTFHTPPDEVTIACVLVAIGALDMQLVTAQFPTKGTCVVNKGAVPEQRQPVGVA